MCYYNGRWVSRAEFIRLKGIEKELKNLKLPSERPVKGFDYGNWPIIKPIYGGKDFDFEIKNTHWEYIPAFVPDEHELQYWRQQQTWLNAKSENLFKNEAGKTSMWKEGALHGRCLVPSMGFIEFQHRPKVGKRGKVLKATEKIPYHITVKDRQPDQPFFIAGISRVWTNKSRQESADTFAIVTTTAEGNELMSTIHNSKLRMPTILPEDLAVEWLSEGLSEARISEIAKYQYPSELMTAWTIDKNFMTIDNPEKEFLYDNAMLF